MPKPQAIPEVCIQWPVQSASLWSVSLPGRLHTGGSSGLVTSPAGKLKALALPGRLANLHPKSRPGCAGNREYVTSFTDLGVRDQPGATLTQFKLQHL